jgi:sulfonate transport system substrate-binding protein
MHTKLRRRHALALGATALLALPARSRAATATTLRVGVYKGQDKLLLPLSGQAQAPYNLEFYEFASGQLIIEAINAGALDYGAWSEIPQAFAAASQANIRAVAVLRGDVNDQAVIVPHNSTITTIAELKGKRVGYVRATTSHYFLLRMLWQTGLDFSDIQAVNLSPADGAAAFAAGQLDAWAIYGYPITIAEAQGGARVLRNATGILSGNYLMGVAPDVLTTPPLRAAAVDYVQRVARSYQWAEAHKAQWIAALAPAIQVQPAYVAAQLEHESQPERVVAVDAAAIASAQAVADTFAKIGLLPGKANVAPYFDTSFTAAIQAANG